MNRRGRFRRKVRAVALLLIVTMLFRGSQNMALTTMSILGRQRLDLNPGVIGAVMAGSALCGVAASAWLAPHVRPQQRTAALAVSLAAVAASLFLFAWTGGLTQLAAAAALLGVGGGLAMPTLTTAAGSAGGANRDRDLALYTVALSLSLALGPLVEALVLRASGQSLTAAFLTFASFPLLAMALLSRKRARRTRPTQADPAPPAMAPSRGGGYRSLVRNRAWRAALTGTILYQVPFVAVVTFGGAMARTLDGASPAEAEVAFGAFFVLSLATRGWAVWRAPIVHKLGAFWLAALLTAGGLVLLALGSGIGWFIVAMALLGVPHGLIFPVALALVADGTGPDELARANAGLLAVTNLVTVAMPVILGVLVDAYGYRVMMLLVLVPVAGFGTLLVLPRGRTDHGRRMAADLDRQRRPPG